MGKEPLLKTFIRPFVDARPIARYDKFDYKGSKSKFKLALLYVLCDVPATGKLWIFRPFCSSRMFHMFEKISRRIVE